LFSPLERLISDAFETKEDAVMVGSSFAPVTVDVFIYNGETNEGGGDANIEQYGGGLGYGFDNETVVIEAHLGYRFNCSLKSLRSDIRGCSVYIAILSDYL